MEHITIEENKLYSFCTLTADEGYVISNIREGFDVETYIGSEKMVIPNSIEYELFIAIPKEQHQKYQGLVNMYLQLKVDNPPIVV